MKTTEAVLIYMLIRNALDKIVEEHAKDKNAVHFTIMDQKYHDDEQRWVLDISIDGETEILYVTDDYLNGILDL